MNIELDFSTYLSEYEQYEEFFLSLTESSLKFLKLNFSPILSVSFIDNDEIQTINKEYRQIDKPTDVISFAFLDNMSNKEEMLQSEDVVVLGEIYISIPKAIEQATQYSHSLHRELSFLFVHGLLHLLGYDHIEKEDEVIMFELQDKILEKEGITR